FLHGRDGEIDGLVDRLRAAPRFLAVLGPSGSGKSSVVQAGLIPRLRRGAVPESQRWNIEMARGRDERLVDSLARASGRGAEDPRFLTVIDQFEEVFTERAAAERESLFRRLTGRLESPAKAIVLIGMRDDFYSRLLHDAPGLA